MGIHVDDDGTVNISGMAVGNGGITVTGDGVTIGPSRPDVGRRARRAAERLERDVESGGGDASRVIHNTGVMNVGSGKIVVNDSTVDGRYVDNAVIDGSTGDVR